jgi:hypothetical protein
METAMALNAGSFFAGVGTVLATVVVGFGAGVYMTDAFVGTSPREPNRLERQAGQETDTKAGDVKFVAATAGVSNPAAVPPPPPAKAGSPPAAAESADVVRQVEAPPAAAVASAQDQVSTEDQRDQLRERTVSSREARRAERQRARAERKRQWTERRRQREDDLDAVAEQVRRQDRYRDMSDGPAIVQRDDRAEPPVSTFPFGNN